MSEGVDAGRVALAVASDALDVEHDMEDAYVEPLRVLGPERSAAVVEVVERRRLRSWSTGDS